MSDGKWHGASSLPAKAGGPRLGLLGATGIIRGELEGRPVTVPHCNVCGSSATSKHTFLEKSTVVSRVGRFCIGQNLLSFVTVMGHMAAEDGHLHNSIVVGVQVFRSHDSRWMLADVVQS